LGYVEILTKRAPQGIAECERALELDRNLASAHAFIGLGKIFVGRAEETEAHVGEALRLSPSDTNARPFRFDRSAVGPKGCVTEAAFGPLSVFVSSTVAGAGTNPVAKAFGF
jgi:hypothetical protein